MADLTQRFLDAVHDYMPQRAQAWIEDRAFIQRIEDTYSADHARDSAQQHYAKLESREFGNSPAVDYTIGKINEMIDSIESEAWVQEQRDAITYRSRHNDYTEQAADHGQEVAALMNERAASSERTRATMSWLRDAGETYMTEVASRTGQPDLFNETVEAYRQAANDTIEVHKPTESASYKIEHAYHDKHFPKVSQEQRDAARASAATPEQAGQMDLRLGEMQKSNDHGLDI